MSVDSIQNVATYRILLNGSDLDDELARGLNEVRVVDYLALPDLCTFTIGLDTEQKPGAKHPIDDDVFKIGDKVKIELGRRDDVEVRKPVFEGEVVTLEPSFAEDGASITVRALDKSHRLQRSRRIRTFQNQTASDIVKKVCSEAGLSPQVDSSGGPYKFMSQDNETDLDFIWRLAHRIGFGFYVEGDKAFFKKPETKSPLELHYPVPVTSFKPRLTSVQQIDSVSVRAWDPKAKQAITGQASSPRQAATIGIARSSVSSTFGSNTLHIATEPVESSSHANALAQSLLDKIANAYITAEGTCFGDPSIRAGSLLKILGLGSRYSGTYRVQSTQHVLRGGGTYDTHFASSAIQTLTGAVAASKPDAFGDGLVIGIVTNNKDPEKMGRVRVKYPSLSDSEEGWWARVLATGARTNNGVLALPKVDDEVLVGFEQGDTTRPLVLGAIHNGKATPGEEVAATDGSLGMLSDEKLVMRSEKDMAISSNGKLELKIKGDATLDYTSKVTETVSSNYEQNVKGQMKVKGDTTVSLEAGAQLTIKGAMVTVEATSQLTLKGQIVQIQGSTVNIGGGMVNLG